MSTSYKKQYGLILPKKAKLASTNVLPMKKPSIFDEDSDSDDSFKKPTGISRNLKRQEILAQSKAVEEDPTVFQYDELYDEMQEKRKESKLSRKDLDRKPKYINKLLVAAEKRKLENDRRIERQVQRERETEGDLYRDKESFVTASYKKKLDEMKAQEELEKREEYLENIGDVKRQGNLDGFYRHLYDQKVNFDEAKIAKIEAIKNKVDDPAIAGTSSGFRENAKSKSGNRQYRRNRQESSSTSSSDEETAANNAHLTSNLDADSDFSIDSESEGSTSNEDTTTKLKKKKQETSIETESNPESATINTIKENSEKKEILHEKQSEEVQMPKIDIWKKRTVGKVFEDALQRYYERKALRESARVQCA